MANGLKGLGRGLDAFFSEDEELTKEIKFSDNNEKQLEHVVELNLSDIEPMLNQPRKIFNEEKLQELANSIKENGVLQPIIVVKDENGYTIVAGERRWRASKLAGLKHIPAIIKDYTDTKKKQVALIENIQREDLNIVEIAKAIKELMDIEGYSNLEVAKLTGKSASTISNFTRLLKLDDKILDELLKGRIVEGHARALLALDSKKKRIEILNKIINKNLTVRETEKLVYGSNEYIREKNKKVPKNIFYEKLEETLKNYFGYKVEIKNSKSNKKIIIDYNDEEGLESILRKLNIKF